MLPITDDPADAAQVRRERDLYEQLLELGEKDDLEPFLDRALALFVEIAGARRGYIELRDPRDGADAPRFSISHDCSEEEVTEIRAAFSRGVIAAAIATGETIATASALDDPRFRDLGSVQLNHIEAVLCAPIGRSPPLGVLYLQEREQAGPFSEDDRRLAERFARHLSVFADRLLMRRQQREIDDPTLPLRKGLRADRLVGRSAALARVLQQISLVAPLDVNVLLTGPSGTGKTHVARVIHDNGPRAAEPFVELNCAALPELLIESELFGAAAGAHSTAARKVEGKVAAAEGGTLFLDEIGDLPLASQSKLLQLLQSREYFPLGSARAVKANVRVIAATNVDLKAAVARRAFREDLFYRLHVLPVRIPSLAERRKDVPGLAEHFCARACEIHGLPRLTLSVGALRAAEVAEWPGNVRELGHAVEAAVIRAAGAGLLEVERGHLFPDPGDRDAPTGARATFQEATRRFQEQLLRATLDETSWNVSEAASRLELARSHVYTLIRAFGIDRQRG